VDGTEEMAAPGQVKVKVTSGTFAEEIDINVYSLISATLTAFDPDLQAIEGWPSDYNNCKSAPRMQTTRLIAEATFALRDKDGKTLKRMVLVDDELTEVPDEISGDVSILSRVNMKCTGNCAKLVSLKDGVVTPKARQSGDASFTLVTKSGAVLSTATVKVNPASSVTVASVNVAPMSGLQFAVNENTRQFGKLEKRDVVVKVNGPSLKKTGNAAWLVASALLSDETLVSLNGDAGLEMELVKGAERSVTLAKIGKDQFTVTVPRAPAGSKPSDPMVQVYLRPGGAKCHNNGVKALKRTVVNLEVEGAVANAVLIGINKIETKKSRASFQLVDRGGVASQANFVTQAFVKVSFKYPDGNVVHGFEKDSRTTYEFVGGKKDLFTIRQRDGYMVANGKGMVGEVTVKVGVTGQPVTQTIKITVGKFDEIKLVPRAFPAFTGSDKQVVSTLSSIKASRRVCLHPRPSTPPPAANARARAHARMVLET